MKKIILSIIFVFILFSLNYKTQAVLGPMLAVNDSLKECQIYYPNSKEELKEGWKNYGPGSEKDCELLGYTLIQGEKITKRTTESLIKYIVTIVVFMGLVFVSYLLFVRKKKKYTLFLLSIFIIYFLLSFIVSLFQRI